MINKTQKVAKLFNPIKMKDIFSRTDFSTMGFKRFKTANNRFYWFKDNGSDILAVAHLDSVKKPSHFSIVNMTSQTRVFSPVLDDRLGAYIITHILPSAGVKFDILLTTDEEIGGSTASYFTTVKKYNWMFQFDRSGNDVVMYDYEDDKSVKILEDLGWHVGYGSYSDICNLDHLGCKGFNFGTAYYDYHSDNAYAILDDLLVNLQKFYAFYKKMQFVAMPHIALPKQYGVCRYDDYDYSGGWSKKNKSKSKYSWDTLGDKKRTTRDYTERDWSDNGIDVVKYDCRYCGTDVIIPKHYMMSYEYDMHKDECCWVCYNKLMSL